MCVGAEQSEKIYSWFLEVSTVTLDWFTQTATTPFGKSSTLFLCWGSIRLESNFAKIEKNHTAIDKKRQSQFEIMRCAFNHRILSKVNLFKLTTMTINMTVVLQCFWTLSRKENTLTIFFVFWYPGMDTDSDTNEIFAIVWVFANFCANFEH